MRPLAAPPGTAPLQYRPPRSPGPARHSQRSTPQPAVRWPGRRQAIRATARLTRGAPGDGKPRRRLGGLLADWQDRLGSHPAQPGPQAPPETVAGPPPWPSASQAPDSTAGRGRKAGPAGHPQGTAGRGPAPQAARPGPAGGQGPRPVLPTGPRAWRAPRRRAAPFRPPPTGRDPMQVSGGRGPGAVTPHPGRRPMGRHRPRTPARRAARSHPGVSPAAEEETPALRPRHATRCGVPRPRWATARSTWPWTRRSWPASTSWRPPRSCCSGHQRVHLPCSRTGWWSRCWAAWWRSGR